MSARQVVHPRACPPLAPPGPLHLSQCPIGAHSGLTHDPGGQARVAAELSGLFHRRATECVSHKRFQTFSEAQTDVFDIILRFNNPV